MTAMAFVDLLSTGDCDRAPARGPVPCTTAWRAAGEGTACMTFRLSRSRKDDGFAPFWEARDSRFDPPVTVTRLGVGDRRAAPRGPVQTLGDRHQDLDRLQPAHAPSDADNRAGPCRVQDGSPSTPRSNTSCHMYPRTSSNSTHTIRATWGRAVGRNGNGQSSTDVGRRRPSPAAPDRR